MQCFQKDPNLRISAKKLLRHPWIMSAKRADAVVPVKPTKYDQAVKTVQEWNEALKSPESTMRRQPRADSASPLPNAINARPQLATNLSGPKAGEVQRSHGAVCPSPDDLDNNVWDDDFTSSIDSSGLKLPEHLKPIDNFAGALSSEKLKAYATNDDGKVVKLNGKVNGFGHTQHDAHALAVSDPLETVRAPSPIKTKQRPPKQTQPDRPSSRTQRNLSQPKTQILRGQAKKPSVPAPPEKKRDPPKRSSSIFKEESTGDYSDLIVEDDDAFDQKVNQIRKASNNLETKPSLCGDFS